MKSFVLAIALLFLTGTQARFPWQNEEPQTPIQHYREVVESYLQKIQDIGKEAATQAESSDIAKQLDLKIRERFDSFSANALALRKQLNPYVEKIREEVSAELQKDIPLLKEKIRPYIETFHNNWGVKVKSFKENIAPLVDQLKQQTRDNVEGFYKSVQPQLEDLRETLRSEVDSLRANIAPYKQELRQKLVEKFEEVKANTGPKAEEYRAQVAQHAENLKQRLGPVIENLKEQLLPKVEEAKVKLAELWQTLKAKAAERYA
ncbi:PREDICTED: apolipoprotein A-I [Nanorana parkeri]|uniref:apolipoprotein A-I n=1 Tax=Nanorana parkeri TaxID=125878 RepID=UPI000854DAC8|nr:PREDICTED: apolipoprotein A-I [Nanorana parkeri]